MDSRALMVAAWAGKWWAMAMRIWPCLLRQQQPQRPQPPDRSPCSAAMSTGSLVRMVIRIECALRPNDCPNRHFDAFDCDAKHYDDDDDERRLAMDRRTATAKMAGP